MERERGLLLHHMAPCYLLVHSVTSGLSKNVLTCDTRVCTLDSVDNEHRRRDMIEINMNDSPFGHIAVKPEIDSSGDVACSDCAGYNMADHQDVIFKPSE